MTVSPYHHLSSARIAVTGGSGFIGTNFVETLADAGAEVMNLDLLPPRVVTHEPYWRHVDVRDRSVLLDHLVDFAPDFVVHLGARTDLRGKTVAEYTANTSGTESVIAAVNDVRSVGRILFGSSRMVCRIGHDPQGETEFCPDNPYGESKAEMERIIRRSEIRPAWAIVRPTSIWGPWFGVPYRTFFLAVARGRYIHPRGRLVEKSFGFVGNTVHQLIALLFAPEDAVAGRLFYLADYEVIEVGDWARRIARSMGAPTVREVPLALLKAAALLGDLAAAAGMQNPPLTTFRLRNLLTPMVHDLSPMAQIAPDLRYSLDEGVAQTVEWLGRSVSESHSLQELAPPGRHKR